MIRKMIIENCNKNRMSTIENGVLVRFNEDDLVNGEYVVPDEVVMIRQFAFNDKHKVKKVILPKTLKRIESLAFYNCGLEEIEIPEGIREIETAAFAKCIHLKDIKLPSTITRIHTNAFAWCDSLKEIVVPADAKIVKYAFGESKVNVVYQENSNKVTR